MFAMLNQLFVALATLFMAGEKAASAINNLAGWGDEASGAFVDEARIKRYAARQQLLKELNITQEQFDATAASVAEAAVKPKMKSLASVPGVTGPQA